MVRLSRTYRRFPSRPARSRFGRSARVRAGGAPASVVEVEPNSVEEWTILNYTHELHDFHIHQLHFRVLESDDKFIEGRMLDTINVPVALPYANWSSDEPVTPGKVRLLMRFHQNI